MTVSTKLSTLVVHGNEQHRGTSGPVTAPIYQSSTYVFPNSEAVEDNTVRNIPNQPIYLRYGNPSQELLTRQLALLEGTEDSLVFSSGMAAITNAILAVVNPGDEVLAIPCLYGQTLSFLRQSLPEKHGIRAAFVDLNGLYELERHVSDKTKLIYFESPTNPSLTVVDIRRLTEQARHLGIKTMIDNTFATPINQTPIALGVDYVVHSATKFLGGHSDLLAGMVAGPKDFIHKCNERMHTYGPTLGPLTVFLLLRSLKTLYIRIKRQNENALDLARFLKTHPKVEQVYYPGLSDDPYHEIASRQMRGFGGIVTCVIKGGKREAMRIVDSLELCINATSLGGVETLVSIPVISSHYWQTIEELDQAGILPQMIRFSVGIEDPEDIISDVDQALAKI